MKIYEKDYKVGYQTAQKNLIQRVITKDNQ
jgi:hypothetical protein